MIKISASFTKKVPVEETYSSDGVHLGVEMELPDEILRDQAEFKQAVRKLFAQACAEVEEQVGGALALLLSLGRRNANMSPADILREAGVERLTGLTKL